MPVRWWHGDHDHIVPFAHGQHVVSKLPDAELYHLPGESHLAGLGVAEEILTTMNKVWDEYGRQPVLGRDGHCQRIRFIRPTRYGGEARKERASWRPI